MGPLNAVTKVRVEAPQVRDVSDEYLYIHAGEPAGPGPMELFCSRSSTESNTGYPNGSPIPFLFHTLPITTAAKQVIVMEEGLKRGIFYTTKRGREGKCQHQNTSMTGQPSI